MNSFANMTRNAFHSYQMRDISANYFVEAEVIGQQIEYISRDRNKIQCVSK